ncbi:MAG: anaerobic ribonucleoside-triphosphate reductase activating protein [Smithellaceae bacterium]
MKVRFVEEDDPMKIGGMQKVSLIDYPGKISAILFTQGCNFRCSYCHNPELVNPALFQTCLDPKDVLAFLQTRQGKLDAVTLTGGEPSLHPDLIPFIAQIRKLGFAVKIDTNGSEPVVLASLIREKMIDFIAMDVKAPMDQYPRIVNAQIHAKDLAESIRIIIASGVAHEFRTTVVKSQLTEEDIIKIAGEIRGAKRYALQKYQATKPLDKRFLKEATYPDAFFLKIKQRLASDIEQVIIR